MLLKQKRSGSCYVVQVVRTPFLLLATWIHTAKGPGSPSDPAIQIGPASLLVMVTTTNPARVLTISSPRLELDGWLLRKKDTRLLVRRPLQACDSVAIPPQISPPPFPPQPLPLVPFHTPAPNTPLPWAPCSLAAVLPAGNSKEPRLLPHLSPYASTNTGFDLSGGVRPLSTLNLPLLAACKAAGPIVLHQRSCYTSTSEAC